MKPYRHRNFYKEVLMPIEVPVGDYCCEKTDGDEWIKICEHFNSERGCGLGFSPMREDMEKMMVKPKECLNLKEDVND